MTDTYYKNTEWLPSIKSEDKQIKKILLKKIKEKNYISNLTYLLSSRIKTENQIDLKYFLKKNKFKHFKRVNIGIISNSNYYFLKEILEFSGYRKGLDINLYFTENNKVFETVLSPKKLFNTNSKMDFIILALDHNYFLTKDYSKLENDVSNEMFNQNKMIIENIKKKLNCALILQTIPLPPLRIFNNYEQKIKNSATTLINRLNKKIINYSLFSKDFIFDVANLASDLGVMNWHDSTFYNLGEFPFNNDFLEVYSYKLSNLISIIKGNVKKVLILDLDDTIWGGTIGDVGYEGIKIGYSDPESKSFLNFQKTILNLKERGVILAVCSKNDLNLAKSAFIKRKDMILKLKDISVFKANWENKAKNITEIQKELNLSYNSMVFVDNNQVERDFIRKTLPDISVPELSNDSSNYGRDLIFPGYFEATNFSKEDKNRSSYYAANIKRQDLKNKSLSLKHYLKTLEMRANLKSFDKKNIDRIEQLIQRSNQFNFTTKRYQKKEILKLITASKKYYTLQSNLEDKFGDNGIVSLVIGKKERSSMNIDTWVMSCRVFSRTLENTILNKIIHDMKKLKIRHLVGEYIKTQKNKIVENLYKEMGFTCLIKNKNYSKWSLDIRKYKIKKNKNIKIY